MHRFAITVCFVLLCLSTAAQQKLTPPQAIADPQQIISQRRDVPEIAVEKLFATRDLAGAAWSPDGKTIAFSSNISGRYNIWTVPAEGGWPIQLTISEQRQLDPVYSPSGKFIAFQSDKDANEQWDILIVKVETGEVTNLTNSPAIAEMNPMWSPDSRFIAWETKPKTGSVFEIEVFDMLLRRRRAITQNTPPGLNNAHPIWSKDGNWLAYTQANADETDSSIFVVEVATGKAQNLTPHHGRQTFFAADWSPDGKKLLIRSNSRNGYENVALLDVASRQLEWLTGDKWEMVPGTFSPDGKLLTFVANVDGYKDFYLYDLAAGRAAPLPLPKGLNESPAADTAFTRDGSRLMYIHSSPQRPPDVWVYNLANKQSHQVTHSLVGGVNPDNLVQPYLVHYPSRDGNYQISALVYAPYNQTRDKHTPAIVSVHDGPSWQTLAGFDRDVQFLANLGYFVIAPNYRGSTGYGKDFQDANKMDLGGGDLEDVLAAAEWIQNTGYIDPKKLIVYGGSYGGYMTLMATSKAPDVWAAGVSIVPVVNWLTLARGTDPALREYVVALLGDPEKNQDLWRERSPINFAGQIKAPLLLMAGGNDPRCPKSEAQQVVDSIRKRGGTVEYHVYEDEGHGFSRMENLVGAYKKIAEFLKFHVPAPGCGCSLE